jgi:hypothetical protein
VAYTLSLVESPITSATRNAISSATPLQEKIELHKAASSLNSAPCSWEIPIPKAIAIAASYADGTLRHVSQQARLSN